MKRILLLTDFSDNAQNAIDFAVQMYKDVKCSFFIMNVHKAGSYTADDLIMSPKDSIHDSITKEPKAKLKAIIDNLKNNYNNSNHSFEGIIDFDVFTDSVNQAVSQKQIDLIILGSNGATGAREVVFGSNTLQIIRNVNCPTFIIPDEFSYKPSNKLVLALDANDNINSGAFTALQSFLEEFPHTFHILRIYPDNGLSDQTKNDEKVLSSLNCTYHVINNVPLHHALNSYLQLFDIDKVAIFSKHESFFQRFITGSPTTKVSKTINVPLLIFHA